MYIYVLKQIIHIITYNNSANVSLWWVILVTKLFVNVIMYTQVWDMYVYDVCKHISRWMHISKVLLYPIVWKHSSHDCIWTWSRICRRDSSSFWSQQRFAEQCKHTLTLSLLHKFIFYSSIEIKPNNSYPFINNSMYVSLCINYFSEQIICQCNHVWSGMIHVCIW